MQHCQGHDSRSAPPPDTGRTRLTASRCTAASSSAADEINSAGGVTGYQSRGREARHQGADPDVMKTVADKTSFLDNVAAVLMPFLS